MNNNKNLQKLNYNNNWPGESYLLLTRGSEIKQILMLIIFKYNKHFYLILFKFKLV